MTCRKKKRSGLHVMLQVSSVTNRFVSQKKVLAHHLPKQKGWKTVLGHQIYLDPPTTGALAGSP